MYKSQLNYKNFALIFISHKNKCLDFRNVKDFHMSKFSSKTDLNGLSQTMDTINQSIKELKAENETLKDDN